MSHPCVHPSGSSAATGTRASSEGLLLSAVWSKVDKANHSEQNTRGKYQIGSRMSCAKEGCAACSYYPGTTATPYILTTYSNYIMMYPINNMSGPAASRQRISMIDSKQLLGVRVEILREYHLPSSARHCHRVRAPEGYSSLDGIEPVGSTLNIRGGLNGAITSQLARR